MRSLRRVLIVHPYGMGDLLFLTPVLRALRLIPSVEKIDLLLGSRTESLIRSNPHINEIFVLDKDYHHSLGTWKSLLEWKKLCQTLRSQKYDLMIDCSLRREYALLGATILQIPKRAGLNYKKRAIFHNIRYNLPEGFTSEHVVESYARLAEKAGVEIDDPYLELYIPAGIHRETAKIIQEEGVDLNQNFAIVSAGGGESWGKDAALKRWPLEHYGDFLNRLSEQTSLDRFLIVGSQGEKELGDKLKRMLKKPSVNFSGRLDILQSASLIKRAKLFVGNDGGLVHIAHALRKPLIAIYGPASPDIYGPYPKSSRAAVIYQPELEGGKPCYQKFRYRSECECLKNLSSHDAMRILKKTDFFKVIEHE